MAGDLVSTSQSFVTLQLEQFLSMYARGAYCVSQRDILRGDFWNIFTSEISEK